MDGQVPEDVKNERLNRLFDVHNKMAFEIVKRYENQIIPILVEEAKEDGKVVGRSSSNKLTYFNGTPDLIGKTVPVRITKAFPAVLRGEIVN